MKREIAISENNGGVFQPVSLTRLGDTNTLTVAGQTHPCMLHAIGAGEYRLVVDGQNHRVRIATHQDKVYVHAFGRSWVLEVADPAARMVDRQHGGALALKAPMPGTVVSIAVLPGAHVHKGQPMLVIESMKMQTELLASRDGCVAAVAVAVGDTFERGAPLLTLVDEV